MTVELLITILIIAAFVRLNVYLATKFGRDIWAWGILGLLFGILSTIVLLVLGETQEKKIANIRAANEASR